MFLLLNSDGKGIANNPKDYERHCTIEVAHGDALQKIDWLEIQRDLISGRNRLLGPSRVAPSHAITRV